MKKKPTAIALIIIFVVILCIIFSIINLPKPDGIKDDAINKGATTEEAAMKREIGNVIEDNTEYFVIENLKGEKYILDKSCYSDFKTGDRVMLSYTEREENSDGTYNVTPVLLDHMKTQPEKAGD